MISVNKIIDCIIQINFDGKAPKNRCFISVIGYNNNVKELCSGWLKDLDAHPLRYETLKKKVPDGTGGIVEVEVNQPIWIECAGIDASYTYYSKACELVRILVKQWTDIFKNASATIVVDCSDKCYAEHALEEINQIKDISCDDGNTLFFGSYSYDKQIDRSIFSNMPDRWIDGFKRYELSENEFRDGVLSRANLSQIIAAIVDPHFLDFYDYTI